jgi:hypothetical protein
MNRLKDIKREILQQHRQLSFNRHELNFRRKELKESVRQVLQSRTALVSTFAAGLLLGWVSQSARGLRMRGDASVSRGLNALGHWLTPVKAVLWNGFIKTITGYTSSRISEELHEHYDQ